jgi:hypothetical protein
MKHIHTYFHSALRGFLVAALLVSCKDDAPDPALPDVSGLGDPNPITTFQVTGPSNGLSLSIKPAATPVVIEWQETSDATGKDVRYEWLADEADGDFSDPLLVFPSDNEGRDTKLTVTYTQLYDALGEAGVAAGAVVNLKWTVRATAGGEKRLATTPRSLTIRRGGFTFIVHVPANTPTDADVYLAGTFGVLGTGFGDWQEPGSNAGLKLTRDDDRTFSITLGLEPGMNLEYKYFLGAGWNGGEEKPNGDGTGTEGASNRRLTVGETDTYHEVVGLWQGRAYPYLAFRVTVPENTPADQDVYIAGEIANIGGAPGNWQQPGTNPALKLTPYGDGTYFIVFPAPANGTSLGYKYFLATAAAPNWGAGEQAHNGPNNCSGRDNRSFTFDGTTHVVNEEVAVWEGYCF